MQGSKRSFAEKLAIISSLGTQDQASSKEVPDHLIESDNKDLQFKLDLSSIKDNSKSQQLRDASKILKESFKETVPALLALNKLAKANNIDSYELLNAFERRYGNINDCHQNIVDRKNERYKKSLLDEDQAKQLHFLQILSGIK